jgi:flagellar assembly protein FliH
MQRLTADLMHAETTPKVLGERDLPPIKQVDTALDETKRMRDQEIDIFDQARKQGYAKGFKDAESEIQKRVDEIQLELKRQHMREVAALELSRRQLDEITNSLKLSIEQYANDSEIMALEIAFASVLRLLGDKAADHSLMRSLCHAVAKEYGHGVVTLRVSEHDLKDLDAVTIDINIEIDRRLKPGQCVIETSRGQFESGIDVRLDSLQKTFLATLNEHRAQQ